MTKDEAQRRRWPFCEAVKGGIEIHTLVDHDGYIPAFVEITAPKVADLTVATDLDVSPPIQ